MDEEEIKPPTAAELNDIDRWLNARRAWKVMRDQESGGPFFRSIAQLDIYFRYPAADERARPLREDE